MFCPQYHHTLSQDRNLTLDSLQRRTPQKPLIKCPKVSCCCGLTYENISEEDRQLYRSYLHGPSCPVLYEHPEAQKARMSSGKKAPLQRIADLGASLPTLEDQDKGERMRQERYKGRQTERIWRDARWNGER